MTAISLTSMSIRRADVSGSVQESNNLRPALGGVLHGDDDALRTCDEVHRTTHPRHHFGPGTSVVERNVAAKTHAKPSEHVAAE